MNELSARLLEFLRAHQVLTLATKDGDGPHAAALFYAVDDRLNFIVRSDVATRHGSAMASGELVAGTVQRDRQVWSEVQGVQFRAHCRALTGVEREAAWKIYTDQFAFLLAADSVLAAALAKTVLWRIEPVWMRLIDNRQGFGHKEEWLRTRN